ncbi:unnamed protein product [Brassica oleracea var. botrytis]
MRRTVTLRHPKREWSCTTSFLGFDPLDGTYKVLSMPCYHRSEGENRPLVLTLNGDNQESWRLLQEITEHIPCSSGQCINGVMYYFASLKLDLTDYILVSFHVRSEKMSMIKAPWKLACVRKIFLVVYHGKLACVSSKASGVTKFDDIEIWILEDAEKHEWSYKNIHLPFLCYDPISHACLDLKGVNDAGELIYVPLELVNPVRLLYYDPNRNSYRRVVVEGLVDDQFRRPNGLGDDDVLRTLAVYSNHIKTLMSL